MEPAGSNRKRPGKYADACEACRRSKVKCDDQKPCSRCIRHGWEDSCEILKTTRLRPHLNPPPGKSGTAYEPESSEENKNTGDSAELSGGRDSLQRGRARDEEDSERAAGRAKSGGESESESCSEDDSDDKAGSYQAEGGMALAVARAESGRGGAEATRGKDWRAAFPSKAMGGGDDPCDDGGAKSKARGGGGKHVWGDQGSSRRASADSGAGRRAYREDYRPKKACEEGKGSRHEVEVGGGDLARLFAAEKIGGEVAAHMGGSVRDALERLEESSRAREEMRGTACFGPYSGS